MTRYLLDTNIVSETRKRKPHGAVVAWLVACGRTRYFYQRLRLANCRRELSRRGSRIQIRRAAIEAWVDELGTSATVLPMDGRCFREMARMMAARQADLLYDAMIAATARLHGLTVATRNEKDFKHLGAEIINPFKHG